MCFMTNYCGDKFHVLLVEVRHRRKIFIGIMFDTSSRKIKNLGKLQEILIDIETDENGFIDRQCPNKDIC